MTVTRARPKLPPYTPIESEQGRIIINNVMDGKTNNGGEVTLTAGAATTTISDILITTNSRVFLTAMSANAAAALSTTYFDVPTAGSIVINHANNGQIDRTFAYQVKF